MTRYRTEDVPVLGGTLRVGVWDSDDVADGAGPQQVVLALHGVTASHLAWALVAEELTAGPGVRLVAPDLRGRGRSGRLPGPWGMPVHADDAARVLDALAITQATVTGHSMGGFAAMVFALRHPDLTSSLVLVDGGIPLRPVAGMTPEESLQATIGPAAKRLSMTFADRQEYQEFWSTHPAFASDWSTAVSAYVDYDLIGEPPALHSSCCYEAVAADSTELQYDGTLLAAWENVAHEAVFLRATAGMLGAPPGLYDAEDVAAWAARHSSLRWRDIADVNHYTITLSDRGARAVAAEIAGRDSALDALADGSGQTPTW